MLSFTLVKYNVRKINLQIPQMTEKVLFLMKTLAKITAKALFIYCFIIIFFFSQELPLQKN